MVGVLGATAGPEGSTDGDVLRLRDGGRLWLGRNTRPATHVIVFLQEQRYEEYVTRMAAQVGAIFSKMSEKGRWLLGVMEHSMAHVLRCMNMVRVGPLLPRHVSPVQRLSAARASWSMPWAACLRGGNRPRPAPWRQRLCRCVC